jgi:hypothetical protein
MPVKPAPGHHAWIKQMKQFNGHGEIRMIPNGVTLEFEQSPLELIHVWCVRGGTGVEGM